MWVVINCEGTYTVEKQDNEFGYETEAEALADADYLNSATFRTVDPLSTIGYVNERNSGKPDDRKKHNDKVTKGYRLKK